MDRKRPSNFQTEESTKKVLKGKTYCKSNFSSRVKLNAFLSEVEEKLSNCYLENKNFMKDESCPALYQEPFKHCVLPGFIEDEDFLEHLQDELLDLTFVEKNNDLYKFHQSKEDLKITQTPYISAVRDLIFVTFKEWLQRVTGIELNDTVDMSCAKYEYTDTLLCHDDELEGRRIAFIYYLVPPTWSEEDGGALQLYTVDDHGQPAEVVKSISPVRNNFVFFEVTPVSFHQVAEVLAEDKTRLSISGWFHGLPVDRPTPYIERPLEMSAAHTIGEDEFYQWINPTYLNMMVQSDIREKFEEESQIELQDFLKVDKYAELKAALQCCDTWHARGPPNKRYYFTMKTEAALQIVKDCIKFLHSDAMFLVLSNLTGLRLHALAPTSDSEEEDRTSQHNNSGNEKDKKEPCCWSEIRRWHPGNYTLVHDTDTDSAEFSLDSILYVGCEGWEPEFGGITTYIAKGEDEELLSVGPAENSLALVYRGEDTLHFVKHLNCRSKVLPHGHFHDISTVYYE